MQSKIKNLDLTYENYIKMRKSIANTIIGNYVIYDQIGRGAYGAVYKGMNEQTGKMIAVKVLDLQSIQRQSNSKVKQIRKRLAVTQSQLMMMCNSENLVKCYDVYQNNSLKLMVIQYCNGDDLQKQIDKKGRIPENQAIHVLKQIICGISELHSHNIVHRDLKAQNIISHNGIYKIADFGFSKQVNQNNQVRQTTLGTITTMAPQVMQRQPYGLKADIWSLGIIFFQMVFGKLPYDSLSANKLYYEIKTKKMLDTQQFTYNGHTASKQVTLFLRQILQVDTTARLGWKELANHPLFANQQEQLSNEFRVRFDISMPVSAQQNENNLKVSGQQQLYEQASKQKRNGAGELKSITKQQAALRATKINFEDDKLFHWVKQTHLQCLKTELIYKQIVERLDKNDLLDQNDRGVVELMYLLTTRCMNNISVINDKIQHYKGKKIVADLFDQVKTLYSHVMKTWQGFSKKLTQVQNQFTSIVADRMRKIFKSESIKEKDRFLIGIQQVEYTKDEQIDFTYSYIQEYIGKIENKKGENIERIAKLMSHYRKINEVRLKNIQKSSFKAKVQQIISL